MKTTLLVALAAAANVASAVQFVDAPEGWAKLKGFETTPFEESGIQTVRRAARDVRIAPKRQEIPTRNPHIANSKTVKIRYGPYTVPGARVYVVPQYFSVSCLNNVYAVLFGQD